MINVLEQIKPLLKFETEDDYYFLQLLMRKKDNPELKSNGRLIKSYYIKNLEYLEDRYDEIKKLCICYNARASLRLNKRSFKSTALKAIQLIISIGIEDKWEFARKAYDKAAGKGHADKEKKWIIDLDDNPNENYVFEIKRTITDCRPEGDKTIMILPTKSGIHLITKPFDLQSFSIQYPNIDIHKDNPINLYIPNSISI